MLQTQTNDNTENETSSNSNANDHICIAIHDDYDCMEEKAKKETKSSLMVLFKGAVISFIVGAALFASSNLFNFGQTHIIQTEQAFVEKSELLFNANGTQNWISRNKLAARKADEAEHHADPMKMSPKPLDAAEPKEMSLEQLDEAIRYQYGPREKAKAELKKLKEQTLDTTDMSTDQAFEITTKASEEQFTQQRFVEQLEARYDRLKSEFYQKIIDAGKLENYLSDGEFKCFKEKEKGIKVALKSWVDAIDIPYKKMTKVEEKNDSKVEIQAKEVLQIGETQPFTVDLLTKEDKETFMRGWRKELERREKKGKV